MLPSMHNVLHGDFDLCSVEYNCTNKHNNIKTATLQFLIATVLLLHIQQLKT